MSSTPASTSAPAPAYHNPDAMLIKVGAAAQVKSAAGSVAHAIRRGQVPTILSAKPASINQAVKALAIARGYLRTENIDFVVTGNIRGGKGVSEMNRVTLRAIKTAAPASDNETSSELKVSHTTNPNNIAGAIAKKVRSGDYPNVTAIGPDAVFVAVIGAIQARRFLRNDNIAIGFKPTFTQVSVDSNETRSAISLTIVKIDEDTA